MKDSILLQHANISNYQNSPLRDLRQNSSPTFPSPESLSSKHPNSATQFCCAQEPVTAQGDLVVDGKNWAAAVDRGDRSAPFSTEWDNLFQTGYRTVCPLQVNIPNQAKPCHSLYCNWELSNLRGS